MAYRRASKTAGPDERHVNRGSMAHLSARGRDAVNAAKDEESAMMARIESAWAGARPHRGGRIASVPANRGTASGLSR
jgi:hypothetical protein